MRPFTLTIGLLLALIVSVNSLAAWDRQRQEAGMRAAARRLEPGLAVRVDAPIDERRFQEARLAVIPAPRLVAFGSSRVREVSSQVVGAGSHEFYNLGMSAATVEDHIALWSLMERAHKLPEIAVFALDAWIFNADREDVRWVALAPEVSRFLDAADGTRGRLWLFGRELAYHWARGKELVSYTTLLISIKHLERTLTGRQRRGDDLLAMLRHDVVAETAVARGQAIRADGSLMRGSGASEPSVLEVREAAVRHVAATGYDLKGFRWDPERARRLELLWRSMRGRGVKILAYMPPYHPAVWAGLREHAAYARALDESASFLRRLADRLDVRFIDLSDPVSVPCDERHFHDGHHARPPCLVRIWARLSE